MSDKEEYQHFLLIGAALVRARKVPKEDTGGGNGPLLHAAKYTGPTNISLKNSNIPSYICIPVCRTSLVIEYRVLPDHFNYFFL